jgi:sensor histidine kinase YesM
MSETKQEQILKADVNKKGVGLWNISQRIKLIYGNSLHIDSAEGIGTKVFFAIPSWPIKKIGG